MTRKFVPLLIVLGAGLVPATAPAAEVSRHVIVAGEIIHPVRVGAGGLSAEQRVDKINERLNAIIAREPLAPSNIRLSVRGGTPSIYVGRSLVTSVTQADADANRQTKLQLARRWLYEYRRVLPLARPDKNWGVKNG